MVPSLSDNGSRNDPIRLRIRSDLVLPTLRFHQLLHHANLHSAREGQNYRHTLLSFTVVSDIHDWILRWRAGGDSSEYAGNEENGMWVLYYFPVSAGIDKDLCQFYSE